MDTVCTSVTFKTTTTFIHEQSKQIKKGLWPFFPFFLTSHHWEGTETDCRVTQYAYHAKTYVCWLSSIICQCSVIYKPALPLPLIPVSSCKHKGESASCTFRRAGVQGKKGDKLGRWSQTETARERARVTSPIPVRVPSTQSVWGVLVTEQTFKKVGFWRAEKLKIAKKMRYKDVGQRSTWPAWGQSSERSEKEEE